MRGGAKAIRSLLASHNIDVLLASYIGADERLASLRLHSDFIDKNRSDLIALLFLNEQVSTSALEKFLSHDDFSQLSGLLHIEGGTASLGVLRLIYQRGAFILCHTKVANGFAYHGADSRALGRITERCRGVILDMCAGVGTQGIPLAMAGSEVVFVDSNTDCEPLFWFNAELNGVVERVKFKCVPVSQVDGTFDWIICNPPLLPVPPNLPFCFAGDGGPNGQRVLVELLREANRLLCMDGRLRFICTVLGTERNPDLSELDYYATEAALSLDLIVTSRTSLYPGEPMFEGFVGTSVLAGASEVVARREFAKLFSSESCRYLYAILGTARRCGTRNSASSIGSVSRHFEINQAFWSL